MTGKNVSIPGQKLLFGSEEFPPSVVLLAGPPGSGKTLYGLQFLKDCLSDGTACLYINCGHGLSQENFNAYFRMEKTSTPLPFYLDPFSIGSPGSGKWNASDRPQKIIDGGISISELLVQVSDFLTSLYRDKDPSMMCIVIDSLSDLTARYSLDEVAKFLTKYFDMLKFSGNAVSFLTYSGGFNNNNSINTFGSLVDGIIQLRMEDSGDDIRRDLRVLSFKGIHTIPRWVEFHVEPSGRLRFGQDEVPKKSETRCKLCDLPIVGPVGLESGSTFHPHCLDTYRKLGDIYGSHAMYALQPGVVNANFFFIDIVGLSDPLLSVEKQIRKIEDLNSLIGSCDAFSKVPSDRKIILPTGDGMVIGFLVNPELPLQLSVQLHQKLRTFNSEQSSDRAIGVRIGLSSGPVFVVSDINNNKNVWGPGIILARRVMDLGDSGHILLADSIAETLTNLKDEYKNIIRLVSGDIHIKHGQLVRLYSAYSPEFGNPAKPTRISESI